MPTKKAPRKVHKFSGISEVGVKDDMAERFRLLRLTERTGFEPAFKLWMRVHKVKPSTHTGYTLVAKKFVEFKGVSATLADLSAVNVSDFIAEREREVSKHSARAAYITMKAFAKWLTISGYRCDLSAVESVKNVPARNRLTKQQITALLAAAASSSNSDRDVLLLKFDLASGLRLNEIRQLQVGDLHFEENYIQVRADTAKNFKARQVRLFPDMKLELLQYLRRYNPNANASDPVFLTQELKMFSPGGLGGLLRSLKRRAGITDRVGWHALRHAYAYNSVAVGMPSFDLMSELGHSNIATTQRYVAVRPPSERFPLAASPLSVALAGVPNAHGTTHTDTRTTHAKAKSRVRFNGESSDKPIRTGVKRRS